MSAHAEIKGHDPEAQQHLERLFADALGLVSHVCEDDEAREGLAALIQEGAQVSLTLQIPNSNCICDITHKGKTRRLFAVRVGGNRDS
ncbi:MAG: hypothetical protein RLZZ200_651 [Pseudomonadota bacterium]|jgi:hypothetical protein